MPPSQSAVQMTDSTELVSDSSLQQPSLRVLSFCQTSRASSRDGGLGSLRDYSYYCSPSLPWLGGNPSSHSRALGRAGNVRRSETLLSLPAHAPPPPGFLCILGGRLKDIVLHRSSYVSQYEPPALAYSCACRSPKPICALHHIVRLPAVRFS